MAEKVIQIEGNLEKPVEAQLEWAQGDAITVEVVVRDGVRLFKNAGGNFTAAVFYVENHSATAPFTSSTAEITLTAAIAEKYLVAGFTYEVRLEGPSENVIISRGKVMASQSFAVVGEGDVGDSLLHVRNQDELAQLEQHGGSLGNYIATSTTSQAITDSGQFALTVEAGRNFAAADEVTILYTEDTSIYMKSDVVSYVGTTLTLDGQIAVGAGTYASWKIYKMVAESAPGSGAVIDDGSVNGTNAWSGTKITTELATKQADLNNGVGATPMVALVDNSNGVTYADQDAVGPQINDAGTAADETWSASKVSTELAGKQASGSYAATSHTHDLADLNQSGATDGQVVKWNNTSGAYEPADESGGGGSDVNASALVAARVGVGSGTELIGDDNFRFIAADQRVIIGGYSIRGSAGEIRLMTDTEGAWASFKGLNYQVASNGYGPWRGADDYIALSIVDLHDFVATLGFEFSHGTTRVLRLTDAGMIAALPNSAPTDGDINNDEAVMYRDGDDIKIRVRGSHATPGSGALGTATLAITWDV